MSLNTLPNDVLYYLLKTISQNHNLESLLRISLINKRLHSIYKTHERSLLSLAFQHELSHPIQIYDLAVDIWKASAGVPVNGRDEDCEYTLTANDLKEVYVERRVPIYAGIIGPLSTMDMKAGDLVNGRYLPWVAGAYVMISTPSAKRKILEGVKWERHFKHGEKRPETARLIRAMMMLIHNMLMGLAGEEGRELVRKWKEKDQHNDIARFMWANMSGPPFLKDVLLVLKEEFEKDREDNNETVEEAGSLVFRLMTSREEKNPFEDCDDVIQFFDDFEE